MLPLFKVDETCAFRLSRFYLSWCICCFVKDAEDKRFLVWRYLSDGHGFEPWDNFLQKLLYQHVISGLLYCHFVNGFQTVQQSLMEHLDTMMEGTDMAEPIDNSIQDIDAHTTCYRVFTYTQYLVSNQDDENVLLLQLTVIIIIICVVGNGVIGSLLHPQLPEIIAKELEKKQNTDMHSSPSQFRKQMTWIASVLENL